MQYVNIFNAIEVYVSKEIFPANEYDLTFGDRKDEKVMLRYYNTRTDKFSDKPYWNYQTALDIARKKASDRRYKNFEFYIDLIKVAA